MKHSLRFGGRELAYTFRTSSLSPSLTILADPHRGRSS